VLVDDGVVGGVIDFGDICAGDPATDLAAAWMLLPTPSLAVFLHTYGPVDDALVARARGWAVLFGLMLLGIGLADRPTYEPVARATLARATATHPDPTTSRSRPDR
jgi:aminoglycoside phosphotransferase (APT) family kinase protein